MPTIDLSITITAVIGLAAIFSPILTALINNHYQLKMKKLELEHAAVARREEHQQEVIEQYVLAAGRCFGSSEIADHAEFGARSSLAIYYTDDNELRPMMEQFELSLHENYHSDENLLKLFERITSLLRSKEARSSKRKWPLGIRRR